MMEELKLKLLFVCALIILMGAAPAAVGDWEPWEDHKMHYPQLPDLNDTGMDVLAGPRMVTIDPTFFYEKFLADDWLCTQAGPVTDIHIWASYNEDIRITDFPSFSLVIYDNAPPDSCYPYSRPNDVLWDAYLQPTAERVYAWDVEESFYDPNPEEIIGWDTEVWQFNFEIDPCDAFVQEEGKIYWLGLHHTFDLNGDGIVSLLDVFALRSLWPGCFGWKTSGEEQFEDDAVWTEVYSYGGPGGDPHVVPQGEVWDELRYPWMHPYEFNSIDLAFVITGGEEEPKPPVEHLKWSQPPIEVDPDPCYPPLYCGWDVESLTFDPCNWWNIVADDYRCLGTMPVTSIHWWGSYLEWDMPFPPAPNLPIAWRIGFWTNVPAGSPPEPDYSYPEVLLWQIEVDAPRVDEQWVGMDLAPWPDPWPESCFQYYVDLLPNEYFWQGDFTDDTNDNVFWISIAAIYAPDIPFDNGWGWKTRPWHWMDDAVQISVDGDLQPGTVLDPIDIWPIEDWYTGESYDAAFELDTDPCWIKWEQAFTGIRDWPHYEDVPSFAEMWDDGPAHLVVAADDWPCKGPLPVTAVVWWGSYLDYQYQPCQPDPTPVAPPEQPAYFWISIWTDVPDLDPNDPAYWSQPGVKIWEYNAYDYDEVLVGYDKHPLGDPNEPVFRYSVRIPDPNWFWQDEDEAVYWISIVAIYEYHYPPHEWGWTNHKHVFLDDAVEGWPLDLYDLEGPWEWYELFDQTNASEDMSFVLFTEPGAERELDFGDAPDPCYPTLLPTGARHIIGGPFFCDAWGGDAPDSEPDGQPDAWATGDDLDADGDDEDGVSIPVLVQGVPGNIALYVCGSGPFGAVVQIWIDFDDSESWEAAEQVYNGLLPDGGPHLIPVTAPIGSVVGTTFARCRISSGGGLAPTGQASDGEVEDHQVYIKEAYEPKPPVPNLKWSQPPIEIDPGLGIPLYCGWDQPSHRDIISFVCWGPTWPCQCLGDTNNDGVLNVFDVLMLKAAWGGVYPDPPYDACTDFDRNLSVDHGDLVILKQNWGIVCPADPGCLEWTGGVPPTGKVEYWDLFAVSLSPAGMYWDLVNGGAGSLADPLVSPDPAGNRVIDNTTPLGGIAYGFGGAAWEDGLLESDSNTYSIQLMGAADYYLSVVLDTNTTPQQDGYVPSWGTISDIVVRPWDPGVGDWGDPCVVNWTISPYDPDAGTVVIGGASSTVTLASNDFLKGEMDAQDLATPGIWGAAVELPPAPGYKVTFTTDVHTWDTYHGLGHEAQIPWEMASDDFRCFGTMPVTSVHWWGSHLGWEERDPPPVEPIAWRIGFWSNVPADPFADPNYSYPDTLLWQIQVDANRVDCNWVGNDWFPDIMMPEACFQYNVQFEPNEYFWQDHYLTQDKTFWISIAAVYPIGSPPVDFPWGWKTRPWSWMDDAVTFHLNESPWIGMALYPWSVTPIEDPLYGESFDLAFELDTDPCYVKWEQAYDSIRHWRHYEDELSLATINRWTDTKWQQQPDPCGWDVCITGWRLADDWQCDETGWVDDIHFWISSERDQPFQIHSIDVEIYSDSPPVPPGHSEPNELKWSRSFSATEFSIVQYGTGDQGWLAPDHSIVQRPDHLGYYLINIDHITDPFTQEVGNIYWLSIQLVVEGHVGWKTSTDHWNDDAVYLDPDGTMWHDMTDPETGETIDLAFEITTEKEELDFSALVADDWPCDDNAPVTAAAWWGSYIGYSYEACQGPPANRPTEPDYFWLTIWDDVPAGVDLTYSHPNNIIWKYDAYDYDEVLVGYDKHPHGEPNEPVFRYSVRIPEEDWFCQNEPNNVYWFSVVAVYEDFPAYDWGWTNHKHVYNDDAVTGYPDVGAPVPVWSWFELYDQNDASEDMSFILFTEPDCFPKTDPKYNQWVLQGKPRAWCCKYQSLGDVTGDGASNIFDLFIFRNSYGKAWPNPSYDCRADLNHDGAVNIFDLFIFRANYGTLFERRYSCPWKNDCGPHPCP